MHGIIRKILNFLFHYIYFYRILLFLTSVLARWRVPYAVEENLRGMNERKNDRMNDTHLGFLILNLDFFIIYVHHPFPGLVEILAYVTFNWHELPPAVSRS